MLWLTEGIGDNLGDGPGAQRQGESVPDEGCCAEYKLLVDFDRDYWILVTPGTQLLVPLPTLSILNLCVR